ncbi:hypothetical protein Bca4012_011996 [Brassica carinata]
MHHLASLSALRFLLLPHSPKLFPLPSLLRIAAMPPHGPNSQGGRRGGGFSSGRGGGRRGGRGGGGGRGEQRWSDDEYDEYGVYQTDIDTSRSQANQYYGPMEYEETSIGDGPLFIVVVTDDSCLNLLYFFLTSSTVKIGVAEAINIVTSIAFLIVFAILRIQPVNDIVYFPKCSNLDFMSYVRFLNWMPEALKMPEPELVMSRFCCLLEDLRTRAQDFFPIPCVAFTTMVHVNWKRLDGLKHSNISYSDIDKLSLSNIPNGSDR